MWESVDLLPFLTCVNQCVKNNFYFCCATEKRNPLSRKVSSSIRENLDNFYMESPKFEEVYQSPVCETIFFNETQVLCQSQTERTTEEELF